MIESLSCANTRLSAKLLFCLLTVNVVALCLYILDYEVFEWNEEAKQHGLYDVLIVGAGLSGAVIARLHATLRNETVLLIDRRNHTGGNLHDYLEPNGDRISLYGPHLFHTKLERVWRFVRQFCRWIPYYNSVIAELANQTFVPIPVNVDTVNRVYGQNIRDEAHMRDFMEQIQIRYPNGPQNAAEAAKARVGQRFYEVLFAGYTSKQWDEDPTNLAAEITQRIPVHYNSDARYFPDAYQALPEGGFSAFIDGLLDHPLIATHTNVDYFDSPLRHVKFKHLYFTGPIDRYFADQGLPPLQYRSLRFRKVAVPLAEQPANSVVNQPRRDVPHTRAMDYGQLPWSARWRGNQSVDTTTIVYEYPASDGVPYYPLLNKANIELYARYAALAQREEQKSNVVFVGRLANYKYFNMDAAIDNAISLYERQFGAATRHTPVYARALLTVTQNGPRQLHQLATASPAVLRRDTLWLVVEQADAPNVTVNRHLESFADTYVYLASGASDLSTARERNTVWRRPYSTALEHLNFNHLQQLPVFCVPDEQLAAVTLENVGEFACSCNALPLDPAPELRVCGVTSLFGVDSGAAHVHQPPAQRGASGRNGRFFLFARDATPPPRDSLWTYVTSAKYHEKAGGEPAWFYRLQLHRIPVIQRNCDVVLWLAPSLRVTSAQLLQEAAAWAFEGKNLASLHTGDSSVARFAMFDLRQRVTHRFLDEWWARLARGERVSFGELAREMHILPVSLLSAGEVNGTLERNSLFVSE